MDENTSPIHAYLTAAHTRARTVSEGNSYRLADIHAGKLIKLDDTAALFDTLSIIHAHIKSGRFDEAIELSKDGLNQGTRIQMDLPELVALKSLYDTNVHADKIAADQVAYLTERMEELDQRASVVTGNSRADTEVTYLALNQIRRRLQDGKTKDACALAQELIQEKPGLAYEFPELITREARYDRDPRWIGKDTDPEKMAGSLAEKLEELEKRKIFANVQILADELEQVEQHILGHEVAYLTELGVDDFPEGNRTDSAVKTVRMLSSQIKHLGQYHALGQVLRMIKNHVGQNDFSAAKGRVRDANYLATPLELNLEELWTIKDNVSPKGEFVVEDASNERNELQQALTRRLEDIGLEVITLDRSIDDRLKKFWPEEGYKPRAQLLQTPDEELNAAVRLEMVKDKAAEIGVRDLQEEQQ